MFGTRAVDSTLFIAISIALGLVLIISFCIWLMKVPSVKSCTADAKKRK